MKKIVAFAAALAAACALAPAAQAQDLDSVRTHKQIARAENLGNPQSVSNTHYAFHCAAHALPDAASVAIKACYLEGRISGRRYNAPTLALPGPTAATTGYADLILEPLRICVQSDATWTDGSVSSLPLECNSN